MYFAGAIVAIIFLFLFLAGGGWTLKNDSYASSKNNKK